MNPNTNLGPGAAGGGMGGGGMGGGDPVALLQTAMRELMTAFQSVGQQVAQAAESITKGVSGKGTAAAPKAPAMPGGGGGGGGGMGNPMEMMGQLKTMALGAVSQIADAVVGTLNSIFGQLQQFVSALNPALVAQVSRAFHDLNAVLGLVAQEAMAMLLPIVRGVADALLPAMRALVPVVALMTSSLEAMIQPMIDLFVKSLEAIMPLLKMGADNMLALVEPIRLIVQIASTMIGVLMPLINAFASFQKIIFGIITALVTLLMVVLMPILIPLQILGTLFGALVDMIMDLINKALEPFMVIGKLVASNMNDLMRVIQVLMQAFQAVVKAIADAITGALGLKEIGSIADVAKSLQEAFRGLLKAVILVVAQFLKMFGFNKGIEAMIKAIQGDRKTSMGMGVANAPALKAIGDLGKDITLQAFIASGEKAAAKQQEDWMADIATSLAAMNADKTMPNLMMSMPKAFAKALREEFTGELAEKAYNGAPAGVKSLLDLGKGIGRNLGR